MKTSKRNKLLGLALTGSFSLFGASGAYAAAGDTISNQATLNYDVGGAAQVLIESGTGAGNSTPGAGNGTTTDFIEDRLINFDIVRLGATGDAVPSGTLQPVTFNLTNNGNAAQGFLLKGLNNADGTADPWGGTNDEFDATLVQTFVENGLQAGYQSSGANQDTAAHVASLASGANVDVYVVSTMPLNDTGGNPLVNGNVAVMTLVAQAAIDGSTGIAADAIVTDDNQHFSPGGTGFTNATADVTAGVAGPVTPDDPTNEEVVFGEAAGTQDGTGAADIVSNGQHSDDSSYTIVTAALNVTKASVALWDPVNLEVNPKSFPGAYVRYTITIENTGTVAADLTTLSDTLAAALDLDADFGDGTAANNPTSAVGDSFEVTHVDNAVTNYCTGSTVDADGCGYVGSPGGVITVDINAVMGATDAQLAAGESLTITFNVVVQ
ncbi:MAG: DUF11 domain-containing protein [Gammaproteobacteria bacterium]|nr:DUF11 domain-containing protein [Gammaproteobacteria bacterium]NNJ49160.1 DUF11 domain-containing protein [Gammaproteobacteria bacterium]